MSEKRKQLRHGQARVQFLIHKEEALKLMEEGYSIVESWEILKEKYKLTLSYQSYRCYISEFYFNKPALRSTKRKQLKNDLPPLHGSSQAPIQAQAPRQKHLAQQAPTQAPTPPQAPPVQNTHQGAPRQAVEPKKPIELGVNKESSFQHGVISAEDKF